MLTDADADIAAVLAEMADSGAGIETAAGPEGETPNFGDGTGPGGENPGQLNTPVTGGAASPASPAL